MFNHILNSDITNVHFNSKCIKPNGLFVPINGVTNDGHSFIKDAIKNGAIATFWNNSIEIPEDIKNKIDFFLVEDTLEAFQELANFYRNKINPIVIGVTGSNGKTTTKEFLYAALSGKFNVHKSTGNYNNHLGVPLTLLEMPKNTEICIVEMGMNHLGEIRVLSKMAEPDLALITNIGESHIGILGSRKNIAKAKLEILEGLKNKNNVIFDGDEELLTHLTGYPILNSKIKNITQLGNRVTFKVNDELFEIPTFGIHNAKNASFAIQTAQLLGVELSTIQEGLRKFKNQPLRLEYKEINTNSFLLDCYNASLTSIKCSLDTFYSIHSNKKKLAILGDIFELGNESLETHKKIGELIELYSHINFWLVGKEMKEAFNSNSKSENAIYFPTKEDLFSYLNKNSMSFSNHYFLLKASRGMKLEDIYDYFLSVIDDNCISNIDNYLI